MKKLLLGFILGVAATGALMWRHPQLIARWQAPTIIETVAVTPPSVEVQAQPTVAPPPIDAPPNVAPVTEPSAKPVPLSPDPTPADPVARVSPSDSAGAVTELRARQLDVPVQGLQRTALTDSFRDARAGGITHEAIDILAPRNTPVVAVEDGVIAKLFLSKAGGITVYQFDPSSTYVYYYAHLERYAADLVEGAAVRRGQVIGYVGTTGNAPPQTPHLHFGITIMAKPKQWWSGTPLNPYLILK